MQRNETIQWTKSLKGTLLILITFLLPMFSSFSAEPAPVSAAAASQCSGSGTCFFIPFVSSRIPSGDLALHNVEVTQAVQDASNSVPLVAGRTTALRIFATSGANPGEAAQVMSNVQVQVTASRGGVTLSNSPSSFQSSVPLSNSRAEYNSTVNMVLPSDWLYGTIDLTVRLDPNDTLSETDEANNSLTVHLTFNPVPNLKIKIVPIRYTHTPNGHTYAAPTQDTISNWMYRIYPVSQIDISWHSAYAFTGNLSTSGDWQRLLDEVSSLKSSEGAAVSEVYYGLIPVSDASSTWFSGGISGIGWIGSRSSVGLNTSNSAAQIAAHEIGHNMGLWHSPCGGASGIDPDYPYKDGSIGTYGLDVVSGTVYQPDINRDLMSYCNPKWVSDYTYKGLYRGVTRYSASQQMSLAAPKDASQRSLLIRARVDSQGAELQPVYVLPGQAVPTNETGQYTVQMFGPQDELLSEVSVRDQVMGLGDAEVSAIHAVVPLPESQVVKIRLVKAGQVLAEQQLQSVSAEQSSQAEASETGDDLVLRWGNSNTPVMIRYSADAGQTWTTLGVDLKGGKLVVSPTMLPEPGGEFEVLTANTWK